MTHPHLAHEPIDPTKDVDALLELHNTDIEALRVEVASLVDMSQVDEGTVYDEIFLLRYVLGLPTHKERVMNVVKTIKYRQNSDMKELIHQVRSPAWFTHPTVEKFHALSNYQYHDLQLLGGHTVYIPMALFKGGVIWDNLEEEEFLFHHDRLRESAFQFNDAVARKARVLCQQLVVMNFKDASLWTVYDRRGDKSKA